MKRTIFLMALAMLAMGVTAQTADSIKVKRTPQRVSPANSTPPQFPGGSQALHEFLDKNMEYPEAAKAYEVEGRVTMSFFVNEDSTLTDITAIDCRLNRFNTTAFGQETEARQKELKQQFAKLFAKEAYRVIRKMPKWKPATLNGQPKKSKYSLNINFNFLDK